jgi:DNA-binding NarL/FixJ family response regulator
VGNALHLTTTVIERLNPNMNLNRSHLRALAVTVERDLILRVVRPEVKLLFLQDLHSVAIGESLVDAFVPDLVICLPNVLFPRDQPHVSNVTHPDQDVRHNSKARRAPEARVTQTQREVLRLLRRGLQNKEIASCLGVAERTVKAYVSTLLMLFDVSNRTELVGYIDDLKLLD